MGVTMKDIFGGGKPEPATPGSYGVQPKGYRLPEGTRLGHVHLRVADLARSLHFYTTVLGLRVLSQEAGHALLGDLAGERALIELHERPGANPAGRRARLGIFHYAILLPARGDLGRFISHLARIGIPAGAGDHLVSEAFYLSDPDGLGIEVYADRPRETWKRVGTELMMATDPVDVQGLVAAAGDAPWIGMPAGTVMGHVHLHVGDLQKGAAFFHDALGFDRVAWNYPGALFLGAGGYHHHLGTNVWAGSQAPNPTEADATMTEWTIELPTAADVAAAATSLRAAGFAAQEEGDTVRTQDPWGTGIRIRVAA